MKMKKMTMALAIAGAVTSLAALAGTHAALAVGIQPDARHQCGGASWYALDSKTASGEMMDPARMTAAHRSLPFGTKIRVTQTRTGRTAIVRVNDRGPFVKGRILDLSKAAADVLGFTRAGHTAVCIDVMP